jgi:hypothetical protein
MNRETRRPPWIGDLNHCCQSRTASPREARKLINAFCFDSKGSELQISWRLRSGDTHASQGGIVSQHQLAKRYTLSR